MSTARAGTRRTAPASSWCAISSARFFDSEMVSTSGEWQKVAIGLFAALLSVGILVLKTYWWRYTYDVYAPPGTSPGAALPRSGFAATCCPSSGWPWPSPRCSRILLWQSLFPSSRDCLALAGLPVERPPDLPGEIRRAAAAVRGVCAGAEPASRRVVCRRDLGPLAGESVGAGECLAANFAATAGACVFVFFSLLALQGILLNVLPSRVFAARFAGRAGRALFIATLGALPLLGSQPAAAAWWPPVWFLRLWEAIVTGPRARRAQRAAGHDAAARHRACWPICSAITATGACCWKPRRIAPRDGRASGSWLLERWIARPAPAGGFRFHLEDARAQPRPSPDPAGLRRHRAGLDHRRRARYAPAIAARRGHVRSAGGAGAAGALDAGHHRAALRVLAAGRAQRQLGFPNHGPGGPRGVARRRRAVRGLVRHGAGLRGRAFRPPSRFWAGRGRPPRPSSPSSRRCCGSKRCSGSGGSCRSPAPTFPARSRCCSPLCATAWPSRCSRRRDS